MIQPRNDLRGWFVAALLGIQALVVVISINHGAFNADDVFFQDAWSRWRPFANEIELRRNTWVLHVPVSWVAEAIFGRSLAALAAAAVVLNAAALLLIVQFVNGLAARLDVSPLRRDLAVATVGGWHVLASSAFLDFTARVNFRNLELGLHLLAVTAVVQVAELQPSRRRSLLLGAALAVLYLNDPWPLFAVVAPTLLIIGIRRLVRRGSSFERRIGWNLLASVACYAVLIGLMGLAGFSVSSYAEPAVAAISSIPSRIGRGIELFLITFGADFAWADRPLSESAAHLIRFVALGLAVGATVMSVRRLNRGAIPIVYGLAGIAIGGFVAYVGSDLDAVAFDNDRFARYLMPVASVVIVGTAIPILVAGQRTVTALVVVAGLAAVTTAISVGTTGARLLTDGADDYLLGDLEVLANELRINEYERGYGDYWAAAPIEYFARDHLEVSMVECAGGEVQLSGVSPTREFNLDIKRTFVASLDSQAPPGCSLGDFVELFGPVRRTEARGRFTVHYFGPTLAR